MSPFREPVGDISHGLGPALRAARGLLLTVTVTVEACPLVAVTVFVVVECVMDRHLQAEESWGPSA